jgi:hypothetical protein
MRGKQLQLLRLTLFVKNFDSLQPARLRRTVQLTEITQRLLSRPIGGAHGFDQ